MARGINKVILVGTLGKDPEVRYSQSGNAMTAISMATNEKWKDRDGEMQERTEWHRVKFFGRLAEIAGEYLKKGSQCYIEGRLRTEKYTDKQGVEKYSTDIIADEMMLLGGRPEGGDRDSGRDTERDSGRGRSTGNTRSAPSRGRDDDTRAVQRPAYGGRDNDSQRERATEPRRAPADDDFPDDDIPF